MKTQLFVAAMVLALGSTTASAHRSGGSISNTSTNALAVGGETLIGSADWDGVDLGYNRGGRAIAGSVYLDDACNCKFKSIKNNSRNAIAVGKATAGSVHIVD